MHYIAGVYPNLVSEKPQIVKKLLLEHLCLKEIKQSLETLGQQDLLLQTLKDLVMESEHCEITEEIKMTEEEKTYVY